MHDYALHTGSRNIKMKILNGTLVYFDGENWVPVQTSTDTGSITLSPIINIQQQVNFEGTQVDFTWDNPNSTEFDHMELYVSTSNITNSSYDFVSNNSTLLTSGNDTSYSYQFPERTKFYFKFYQIYYQFGSYQTGKSVTVEVVAELNPQNVTNLNIISQNDGSNLTLSFNNPEIQELLRTEVYLTDQYSLENYDYTYVSSNFTPIINDNITESFIKNDVTLDTMYYAKQYSFYDDNGEILRSTGISTSGMVKDIIPPGPITNFQQIPETDTSIRLKWVNPSDTDFNKVKIYQKQDSYPQSPLDGVLVYDGNLEEFLVSGLTKNNHYYYRQYTYDISNNVNNTTDTQQAYSIASKLELYGLRYDEINDTYTRLEQQQGLIQESYSSTNTNPINDFDDKFPYKYMVLVNIDTNGDIVQYQGDPTFQLDGVNGDVFTRIPKFYYKVDYTNGVWEIRIQNAKLLNFKTHPWFIINGTEYNYAYVSSYEGHLLNNMLYSISGVTPSGNSRRRDFRDQALLKGSNFRLLSIQQISALQILYSVEYQDFKIQDVIGKGITNYWSFYWSLPNTGSTDSYLNNSYGETNNYVTQMRYRGIENLYGSKDTFIDGINIEKGEIFLSNENFDDTNNASYISYGTNVVQGYISKMNYNQNFNNIFFSSEGNGQSNTHYGSYSTSIGWNSLMLFGGDQYASDEGGMFSYTLNQEMTQSNNNYNARLEFHKMTE